MFNVDLNRKLLNNMRVLIIAGIFLTCCSALISMELFWNSLIITTIYFLACRKEIFGIDINRILLNKIVVKIQGDLKVYDSPNLIKSVCLKAYKKDSYFYSKDTFGGMFRIDDSVFYPALIKAIIRLESVKHKWYGKFYLDSHWKELQRIDWKLQYHLAYEVKS